MRANTRSPTPAVGALERAWLTMLTIGASPSVSSSHCTGRASSPPSRSRSVTSSTVTPGRVPGWAKRLPCFLIRPSSCNSPNMALRAMRCCPFNPKARATSRFPPWFGFSVMKARTSSRVGNGARLPLSLLAGGRFGVLDFATMDGFQLECTDSPLPTLSGWEKAVTWQLFPWQQQFSSLQPVSFLRGLSSLPALFSSPQPSCAQVFCQPFQRVLQSTAPPVPR